MFSPGQYRSDGIVIQKGQEMKVTTIIMLGAMVCCGAAQAQKPEWCRKLPRPEYRGLERMSSPDPWFWVYRIRLGVFAIYETRPAEEAISYLIVCTRKTVLFDTGLGISNIKTLVTPLT